jgi:hypothetical protein
VKDIRTATHGTILGERLMIAGRDIHEDFVFLKAEGTNIGG